MHDLEFENHLRRCLSHAVVGEALSHLTGDEDATISLTEEGSWRLRAMLASIVDRDEKIDAIAALLSFTALLRMNARAVSPAADALESLVCSVECEREVKRTQKAGLYGLSSTAHREGEPPPEGTVSIRRLTPPSRRMRG